MGAKTLYELPFAELLEETVKEIMSDVVHGLEGCGSGVWMQDDVEKIETRHRDGYIPFTNGAYVAWGFACADALDQVRGIPPKLQTQLTDTIDYDYELAVNACNQEYGQGKSADNMSLQECDDYYTAVIQNDSDAKDYFDQMHADLMQDSEVGIKVGVTYHAEEEQPLTFWMCINTDYRYFRSNAQFYRDVGQKHTVEFDIAEVRLALDEVTESRMKEIREYMTNMLFTDKYPEKKPWLPRTLSQ